MLNRSASLAMSTSVLKALPGKLDIKRHSPSILYISSLQAHLSSGAKGPQTGLSLHLIACMQATKAMGSLLRFLLAADNLCKQVVLRSGPTECWS